MKTKKLLPLTTFVAAALALPAWAETNTWTGNSYPYYEWTRDGNWSLVGGWTNGDDAVFGENYFEQYTVLVDGEIVTGNLTIEKTCTYTFDFGYSSEHYGDASLTVTGDLSMGEVRYNVDYSAHLILTNFEGRTVTFEGAVTINRRSTLTTSDAGTIILAGSGETGKGTIEMSGGGMLIVTGDETINGTIAMSGGGTLILAGTETIAGTETGEKGTVTVSNGGTLEITGYTTIGTTTEEGTVEVTGTVYVGDEENNATLRVYYGSLKVDGSLFLAEGSRIILSSLIGDVTGTVGSSDGTGEVVIEGTVLVRNADITFNEYVYVNGGTLDARPGAKIYVAKGALVTDGGKIETVDEGAMLVFEGTTTVDGGAVHINRGDVYIGYDTAGTLQIVNGEMTQTGSYGDGVIYIGSYNQYGTLTIGSKDGTGEVKTSFNSDIYIGRAVEGAGRVANGSLEIYAGENEFNGNLYLGDAGRSGNVKIYGGTNIFRGEIEIANSIMPITSNMVIYDGETTFEGAIYVGYTSTHEPSYGSSATGILEIHGGTNTFGKVYVANYRINGEMVIDGGYNTFTDIVNVGGSDHSTGTMQIEGGTNIFEGTVTIAYGDTYGKGSMTITGGETTFVGDVVVGGNSDSSGGTLTIGAVGGTNDIKTTFEGDVYIGQHGAGSMTIYDGTNIFKGDVTGRVTLAGGTTSFEGAISSLTIEGDAVVLLDSTLGTSTESGKISLSENSQIVLSDTFLLSAITTFDGEAEALTIIMANSITYDGEEVTAENVDEFADFYIFYDKSKFDLSDWTYDDGVISAVVTYLPEPALFSVFLGSSALGLVAARRRRRKVA